MVKVKMVKIDSGYAVIAHYSINIYIYTIVADFDNSILILTKMTLTTLTTIYSVLSVNVLICYYVIVSLK